MATQLKRKLLRSLDVAFLACLGLLSTSLLAFAVMHWPVAKPPIEPNQNELSDDEARRLGLPLADAGDFDPDAYLAEYALARKDGGWRSRAIPAPNEEPKTGTKQSWEDLPDVVPVGEWVPQGATRLTPSEEAELANLERKKAKAKKREELGALWDERGPIPPKPDPYLAFVAEVDAMQKKKESGTAAGLALVLPLLGLGLRRWVKWLARDEPTSG